MRQEASARGGGEPTSSTQQRAGADPPPPPFPSHINTSGNLVCRDVLVTWAPTAGSLQQSSKVPGVVRRVTSLPKRGCVRGGLRRRAPEAWSAASGAKPLSAGGGAARRVPGEAQRRAGSGRRPGMITSCQVRPTAAFTTAVML